jgi:glycosyltransferase involved in cell wall biosynthesis
MGNAFNIRKICFVGTDNYPVLNPSMGNVRIGGESVQQTLLARQFAGSGYDVSMIVKDYGQPDGEVIDGIKVFKTYRPQAGLPFLRFVHPRATSVFKALQKADADVYYQSCAGAQTGFVAWHSRRNKKKFIFRVASDTDCIPGKQLIGFWRDRKLYEYGLKRADLILVQSQHQIELLTRYYKLNSVFVNMIVESPPPNPVFAKDIDVLWVSNMRPLKRPEFLFEIALSLPQCRFVMIGGPATDSEHYFRETKKRAKSIRNLEFLGPVPYSDVNDYFATAKVFVNTSDIEGFPNTFLQAWIHGTPVVSFFDPDNIIEKKGLGFSPADLEEMIHIVDELILNENKRIEMSRRVREYALENYSPQAVLKRHIEVFSEAFS